MRVAHVVQDLDPAMGGLTTVPINMARALAQAGVDVEIWTGAWHQAPLPEPSTLKGSITLVERKASGGFLDSAFFNAFRNDIERVDVVHTHSFWRPYCARFASACAKIGKPIVHTMHGMLMEHPMRFKTPKKRVWMAAIGKRHLKRLNAVQMLNREESEQSAKLGANFRYFELPNGVDPKEFAALPARGGWRATEPDLADKIVILSMGRLHEIKGPELLLGGFLDLAAERADIALVMAGPEEGMKATLDGMLRGHPAAGRVRMPGLVRGADRLALFADADIFAQTSRHETMSMSIIEAMYAAKPTLVTKSCHFPEIGESGAGLIVPPTRDGVREGLKRLVSDREKWGEYGRNARRLIDERFTLGAVTTKLIEHYERVIRGEKYPWILERR